MTPTRVLAALSLVLAAFTLRIVFTSLSPVLPEMMAEAGGGAVAAALLVTLPVFCLGAFAPVAPWAAFRYGPDLTVAAALAVLAAGTALRSVPLLPAIFAGSLAAAAAIAVVNVLLPSFVKRDFPDRAALVTGLYSMALTGGATLAAGATVPIAAAFDGSWRAATLVWAVPPALVSLLWLLRRRPAGIGPVAAPPPGRPLWRDAIAWQLTLFLGLQSALAYCVFGWVPSILRERGLDASTAGYALSLSVSLQVAASFAGPTLARLRPRTSVVVLVVLAVGGLLGFLFGPLSLLWGFAVLQGIGQGALLPVALTFVILRSPDPAAVARLSAMAQGIGYVLAGFGPLLVGFLRATTGGFAAAGILFFAAGLGCLVAGLGAARPRFVAR